MCLRSVRRRPKPQKVQNMMCHEATIMMGREESFPLGDRPTMARSSTISRRTACNPMQSNSTLSVPLKDGDSTSQEESNIAEPIIPRGIL